MKLSLPNTFPHAHFEKLIEIPFSPSEQLGFAQIDISGFTYHWRILCTKWNGMNVWFRKCFVDFQQALIVYFGRVNALALKLSETFATEHFSQCTFRKIDENRIFGPSERLNLLRSIFQNFHTLGNFVHKMEWNGILIQKFFCWFSASPNSVLWQGKCAYPETVTFSP